MKIQNNIELALLKSIVELTKNSLSFTQLDLLTQAIDEFERRYNMIDRFADYVSEVTGVSVDAMKKKSRKGKIPDARALTYYFIKNNPYEVDATLDKMGEFFGGQNHATVLHGINKIETLRKNNKEMKAIAEKVETLIKKRCIVLDKTHAFYFSQVKFDNEKECKFLGNQRVNIVKKIGEIEQSSTDAYLVDYGNPKQLRDTMPKSYSKELCV